MFRILAQHWKGTLPLWWTFSVNFIPASVLVLSVLRLDWAGIAHRLDLPFVIVLSLLAFLTALVVIWQITGMLRTLRTQMAGIGGVADSGYVYILLFVYVWLVLFSVLDFSRFVTVTEKSVMERPRTLLSIDADQKNRTLKISGDIEFGLTRKLSTLLAEKPAIKRLELSSAGGIVSEARGVAKLVQEQGLETHVEHRCYSACTLIFIASTKRTLGSQGELGFHQYSMDGKYNTPWVDPEIEQQRDADFMLRQGVKAPFISRTFSQPHNKIWRPSHQQLLDAGVVMAIEP